ncbi:MAG: DUF6057 family protein [Phocaeicola sp.]
MRNREETFINQHTARNLWIVCGLFFSIFSFIYLYIFQKDVITALHYSLAQGKTHYSPLVGAIMITVVLWMVQWGINMLLRLKGAIAAFAYFPSFLLLGVLTDISYSVAYGEAINELWSWLLPVSLLLFIGSSLSLRKKLLEWTCQIKDDLELFYSNTFILVLGALMTLSIGNTNIHFHHELAIESAIKKREWVQAREVGINSLETTQTLTALRAFALSQEGMLGEYLFNYPQPYHSNGLLIDPLSASSIYYSADSIFAYLGAQPQTNESTASYLERIYRSEEGRYTATDYYLCALLLDKKLESFASELALISFEEETLPRYYQEAAMLYMLNDSTYTHAPENLSMNEHLEQFLARQKELNAPIEEKNRMRREFGDTYWWYFFYQ